ncbi:MAG: hypothetical protein IJZ74_00975 [Clostridia bacterium]|nr:hypothetical protein [Clostridia bacterium]
MKKLITLTAALVLLLSACCACAEGSVNSDSLTGALDSLWGDNANQHIAPFLDFTWGDVLTQGETLRNTMPITRSVKVSFTFYDYTIWRPMIFGFSCIGSSIVPENESELEFIWRYLGQECIQFYDEYKQIDTTDNGLIAYEFSNAQTDLRLEYIDSPYSDYIMFMAFNNNSY